MHSEEGIIYIYILKKKKKKKRHFKIDMKREVREKDTL